MHEYRSWMTQETIVRNPDSICRHFYHVQCGVSALVRGKEEDREVELCHRTHISYGVAHHQ